MLAVRVLAYLIKLSCGHIKSTDIKPDLGEHEWCNMCGDFKTVIDR